MDCLSIYSYTTLSYSTRFIVTRSKRVSEQKTNAASPNLATWVLAGILVTGILSVILFFILDTVRKNAQPNQPALVTEGSEDTYTGTAIDPPLELPDFTLTDQTGQPFQLSSLRGRVVLMFFGYTHCPDFCPTTLSDFTIIKHQLGEAADEVAFVFVSVDGERDTPEVMARYISAFDTSFIGLSGTTEQVQTAGAPFGLTVQRQGSDSETNYLIDHTVSLFIIDREGRFVRRIAYGTAATVVAQQVQLVIEQ
jgi:protein SCO1/2